MVPVSRQHHRNVLQSMLFVNIGLFQLYVSGSILILCRSFQFFTTSEYQILLSNQQLPINIPFQPYIFTIELFIVDLTFTSSKQTPIFVPNILIDHFILILQNLLSALVERILLIVALFILVFILKTIN